jgi:ribonuclease HII
MTLATIANYKPENYSIDPKYQSVIGADEVGYGAVAGPLVIVGVKAPRDWNFEGLNDSKKMTPGSREAMRPKLAKLIDEKIITWHLAERSNVQIDKVGVATALRECYIEVFAALHDKQSLIIVDGNLKFDKAVEDAYDRVSLVKADGKIPAVAAASILAKTYRDGKMKILHPLHPMYSWDSNMGYPNPEHLQAISKHGPCPLHRFSYAPMRNMKLSADGQLKLPGT